MAKNLKLNVKNAQLAEALKLGQVKRPSIAKKKKVEEPSSVETSEKVAESAEPIVQAAPPQEKAPAPKIVEEAPPVVKAEEKVRDEPSSPAPEETQRHEDRPAPQSTPSYNRPPSDNRYNNPQHRPQNGPSRYPSSSQQQPYQRREGSAPPYQRREGSSYPSSQQPQQPYQRREGSAPPYQRREGSSYPSSQQPQQPYPRREGSHPPSSHQPYPRREGNYPSSRPPYPPRPGQGTHPTSSHQPYVRREGSYPSSPRPHPQSRDLRQEMKNPLPPKEGAHVPDNHPKKKPPGEETESRKPGFKDFRDFKNTRKQPTTATRSFDSRDKQGLRADQEDQAWRKRRSSHKPRPVQQEEIIRPKELQVRVPITVKDLASEMKLKASQLISKLFMKGVTITLNDFLDDETTIQLLGHDFDCQITIDTKEEDRLKITDKTIKQEIQETNPSSLILRPPVAAFMGHVDHGKTSLIDAIRTTNMTAGEAGEITQHIGAFKCHTAVGDLTILDTPGHEAFSAMRARGADVTDIVVLVVAGDEGLRTQTLEAIQQAQAANCPIIVAINKCDKPNFNADNVYRQLADQNLLPEPWGGTTITVNCSAVSKEGVKELLEMLALQAEILELKANPNTRARGTVIESEMHKGMGAVATVLVQNGTLRIGDSIVFAQHYARVKTMQNEHGKDLTEANPSTPVKITGLSGLPEAGSEFIAVSNEKEAKDVAEKRSEGKRAIAQQIKRGGLDSLLQDKQQAPKKFLNLILRADVQGSVEALKISLLKIVSNKVELNFISTGVGEVSESDVQLASASKATIIGFHTQIESHAESLIKQTKVNVKLHDIIYHAVDDVREMMLNLLDKIPQENETGSAEVKAVFKSSHLGSISGCMVLEGTIKRSNHMRIFRDGKVIWKGAIASLKRVKEDVREVSKGYECGILLQNYNETKVGDILQAYEITYLTQEL